MAKTGTIAGLRPTSGFDRMKGKNTIVGADIRDRAEAIKRSRNGRKPSHPTYPGVATGSGTSNKG